MRKLMFLVTLVSILVLVLVLNVGVAFADHSGEGTDTAAANGACAPVGSHIVSEDAPGHPGYVNGFDNFVDAIANNPLCPLHVGGPCEP